jgi:capsid protein
MSAGLGVAFSSLSNDLSDVNFSSIRAGLIEERETWKALQKLFVEVVNDRVFSEWLLMALTTGAVNLHCPGTRNSTPPNGRPAVGLGGSVERRRGQPGGCRRGV